MNKHTLYIETVYRISCPKCKKFSYYNNGNTDDYTVADIEGFECPYCHYQFTCDILMDEFVDDDIEYKMGKILMEVNK